MEGKMKKGIYIKLNPNTTRNYFKTDGFYQQILAVGFIDR